MKDEIGERLFGLESIIHEMHHNLELLRFLSYNLHKEKYNLHENLSLYWIWGLIMATQILDFYKIMNKNEKFSFTKIINISKSQKDPIDFELVDRLTNELIVEYDNSNFELVRSKYIAHQDLNMGENKTDLDSIGTFTERSIELFCLLSDQYERKKAEFTSVVCNSFKEIFDSISEFENVKALCLAAKIKGKETIEIDKIAEIINGN